MVRGSGGSGSTVDTSVGGRESILRRDSPRGRVGRERRSRSWERTFTAADARARMSAGDAVGMASRSLSWSRRASSRASSTSLAGVDTLCVSITTSARCWRRINALGLSEGSLFSISGTAEGCPPFPPLSIRSPGRSPGRCSTWNNAIDKPSKTCISPDAHNHHESFFARFPEENRRNRGREEKRCGRIRKRFLRCGHGTKHETTGRRPERMASGMEMGAHIRRP